MLESRLNKWISSIVATATLTAPTVAYAERLSAYLNGSASTESRYHLLDTSKSISGIEEIAQDKKSCPPQLYYLPECQQQLRQQQSAPNYVPPNQQPAPQQTYVPQPSPQPTYQPSYSAPPEKEEKSHAGWYLIGGGVAVVLTGMALSTGFCSGEESYGEDPCENEKTPAKIGYVIGLGLIIWGIVDLNSD